MFYRF